MENMIIYVVDFSLYDVKTGEGKRYEDAFATYENSLHALEEAVSDYASKYNCTYTIHSIKNFGYPYIQI